MNTTTKILTGVVLLISIGANSMYANAQGGARGPYQNENHNKRVTAADLAEFYKLSLNTRMTEIPEELEKRNTELRNEKQKAQKHQAQLAAENATGNF